MKSLLIHGLLSGYPVNPIYVVEEDNTIYTLDGSQRPSTCISYINNEFALSKDTPSIVIDSKENVESVSKEYDIDERGMTRLEKLSFDAYNESDVLIGAIERYRKRTGHYPERALADNIYLNRENLAFCKLHGIRLSGPSLGRPKKNALVDKKTEFYSQKVLQKES